MSSPSTGTTECRSDFAGSSCPNAVGCSQLSTMHEWNWMNLGSMLQCSHMQYKNVNASSGPRRKNIKNDTNYLYRLGLLQTGRIDTALAVLLGMDIIIISYIYIYVCVCPKSLNSRLKQFQTVHPGGYCLWSPVHHALDSSAGGVGSSVLPSAGFSLVPSSSLSSKSVAGAVGSAGAAGVSAASPGASVPPSAAPSAGAPGSAPPSAAAVASASAAGASAAPASAGVSPAAPSAASAGASAGAPSAASVLGASAAPSAGASPGKAELEAS